MNIPDHTVLPRTEQQFFGLKILKFLEADPDPGSEIFLNLDPGLKKFGSGINIPDPQHCFLLHANTVNLSSLAMLAR
jgi:hypothetical protein